MQKERIIQRNDAPNRKLRVFKKQDLSRFLAILGSMVFWGYYPGQSLTLSVHVHGLIAATMVVVRVLDYITERYSREKEK